MSYNAGRKLADSADIITNTTVVQNLNETASEVKAKRTAMHHVRSAVIHEKSPLDPFEKIILSSCMMAMICIGSIFFVKYKRSMKKKQQKVSIMSKPGRLGIGNFPDQYKMKMCDNSSYSSQITFPIAIDDSALVEDSSVSDISFNSSIMSLFSNDSMGSKKNKEEEDDDDDGTSTIKSNYSVQSANLSLSKWSCLDKIEEGPGIKMLGPVIIQL